MHDKTVPRHKHRLVPSSPLRVLLPAVAALVLLLPPRAGGFDSTPVDPVQGGLEQGRMGQAVRTYADGAADIAFGDGLAINLPPALTSEVDTAVRAQGDDAMAERIAALVARHAQGDARMAAAIGRYAAARAPGRRDMVSLGVLRGNPAASTLLLESQPGAGPGQPGAQAGTRAGIAQPGAGVPLGEAAHPGDMAQPGSVAQPGVAVPDGQTTRGPATADTQSFGSAGTFGGLGLSDTDRGGSGGTRFPAPRRSLIAPDPGLAVPPSDATEPPPADFASPSLP